MTAADLLRRAATSYELNAIAVRDHPDSDKTEILLALILDSIAASLRIVAAVMEATEA